MAAAAAAAVAGRLVSPDDIDNLTAAVTAAVTDRLVGAGAVMHSGSSTFIKF